MAQAFHLHKPYVLASLPRPIDPAKHQYAVREVYGYNQGSKKRRRQEVAVGIDSEAVNLYHISESRLITSYSISPRASFTCAPYSIRCRAPKSKGSARYTYASTKEPSPRITLFKDTVDLSGSTQSTTASKVLERGRDVVYLTTLPNQSPSTQSHSDIADLHSDLIAIGRNGSIWCLDGETLEEKWQSSLKTVAQDWSAGEGLPEVELAHAASATDITTCFSASTGIPSLFPEKIAVGGYNPELLVLVTRATKAKEHRRRLHILALPTSSSEANATPRGRPISQIYSVSIPSPAGLDADRAELRIDLASASLLELRGTEAISYDIAGSAARLDCRMEIPGVTSIIRLSKSSILAATTDTFEIYNPLFRAMQASVPLDSGNSGSNGTKSEGSPQVCTLVAHFLRLDTAVAVIGTNLVAVRLEPPKTRSRKRRADGLLIDSIGRGVGGFRHHQDHPAPAHFEQSFFTSFTPGSISDEYWKTCQADAEKGDALLSDEDVEGFERFIANKFGLLAESLEQRTPGRAVKSESGRNDDCLWPKNLTDFPDVDRRWVIYTLARVFTWRSDSTASAGRLLLIDQLSESKLLTYLVAAGHISVPNLASALRDDIMDIDNSAQALGAELPELIMDLDPTMGLLQTWLSTTKLGTTELLISVRLIMQSLDLVQDPLKMAPRLLDHPSVDAPLYADAHDVDEDRDVGMELDRLEQDLQITEHYLKDENGDRAAALSVALKKLGGCPAPSMVRDLRQNFKPEEILSLIYVLRMGLVKNGWTTRYLDVTQPDVEDDVEDDVEPPLDGSIRLIADLLCRCIDSVGPGGWLINDAMIAAGHSEHLNAADFLTSLKLEVSAALEGVQEAVYLRGVLADAVRYGEGTQKFLSQKDSAKDKAIAAARARPEVVRIQDAVSSQMLPLGLKPPIGTSRHEHISLTKVLFGGEVVKRSKRELGRLESKKVGPYSLQRINI